MNQKRDIKPEDLYDFELISGPELSKDGKTAVFEKQWVDKNSEKIYKNLYLLNTENQEISRFTTGKQLDMNPKWSNDGEKIAFLSNREDEKQFQLYLIPANGGEAVKLTDLNGIFGEIVWSPNDKEIVFTFSKKDEKLLEMEEDDSSKGLTQRTITDMFYKNNGQGFLYRDKMHLWKINIENLNIKQLTSNNKFSENNPVWDNKGDTIYFLSNRDENPEKNPYLSDICKIDSEGENLEVLDSRRGSKHSLNISPNGNYLSYVGFEIKEKYVKLDRLWIMDVRTNKEMCLTEEYDRNIGSHTLGDMGEATFRTPVWSRDSQNLYVQMTEHGKVTLNKVEIRDKRIKRIINKKGVVGKFSVNNDEIYYYFKSFTDPNQLYKYNTKSGEDSRLTEINRKILDKINLKEPEEVWLENEDSKKLQGWILKPPKFDKNKEYPSILEIHGGPRAQYGWGFMHEFHYLASKNYIIYFSNPRGGDGYGQKHMEAIDNQWGTVDYKDLMSWTDYMENKDYIDKKRMGVTGGSYGGYMTNWIITHTDRFKAAVTQRCVSNLISFWGSSDMNWLTQILFGSLKAPWDDFDNYWNQSPMKYMDNVETPTMVIHSENDLRCDIEQAEQVFTALKYRGVETKFVRFPEENHGLSRNGRTDRRISRLKNILEWFEKYLKDKG
ncbi:MAG: S9 family peptidase [Candidatus Mcinerneyibacterium aminivorans]|uniref:S9 family peptidase n=1 Tax=Candidatus Mcinerneyibacterium aminivorans TaxID=2703815 RepID=A0A5D0MND8_9BACT|nr:MAG: S9 family peptidase [Candidatus Mcinerneyibacterium aminivorans]